MNDKIKIKNNLIKHDYVCVINLILSFDINTLFIIGCKLLYIVLALLKLGTYGRSGR